jgi:hypothetical protein
VSEDVPDIDDLPSVLDRGDQPIGISFDIEHRESSYCIRVRKVSANIRQVSPGGSLGDAVPMQQSLQRILVDRTEFRDRGLADDPHNSKLP